MNDIANFYTISAVCSTDNDIITRNSFVCIADEIISDNTVGADARLYVVSIIFGTASVYLVGAIAGTSHNVLGVANNAFIVVIFTIDNSGVAVIVF